MTAHWTAPIVSFKPDGDRFVVSLANAKDTPTRVFSAYRSAVKSSFCTWDRARSTFSGAINHLTDTVAAVRRAGFGVELPPELLVVVERVTAERTQQTDSPVPMVPDCTLMAHQAEGIRFMRSRKNENRSSILADDMGLGKTLQALMSLDEGQRAIVVCPKIAKHVWKRETELWRPDLLATICETAKDFRWPRQGEIIVVNFPLLPRPEEVAESFYPRLPEPLYSTTPEKVRLIGDEVHFVKEPTSQRTRAFKALSDAIREKGGVASLLSGTPLVNHPSELWAVLQSAGLGYEAFGDYETFRKLFAGTALPNGTTLWGTPDPEVAQRLARVMLRRTKDGVLDLPPKRHEVITVDADLSDAALVHVLDLIDGGAETVSRWKSLRDLDGLPIEELSRCRAALALAKLPAAIDMLDQIDEETDGTEPVVVFSAHRQPVDTIAQRPGWASITGDTSTAQRMQIEKNFQAGKLKGIAATIAAAGTALTLTRASTCLFVDQAWTPAANMQAEDRIYRIGQTRSVRIIILSTAHPLDYRVNQLLVSKRKLIAASIDAVANVERVL